MDKKTQNIEITVNNKTYEVIDTTTDNTKDTFTVELGLKGDDDSLIELSVSLEDIYDDLLANGECDAFTDVMGNDGEHRTDDYQLDPADVWQEYSHAQQIEFVNEDIVKHLKSL